jgi:general secretion pathway protein H
MTKSSLRVDRVASRGLSLIEIFVVMAIIALVTMAAVGGSMQLPSSRLRRSATMMVSAIKVAFTRSTATSRDLRLVMDLDTQKMWLEQADIPMLVQSKDKEATGGADPVTAKEREVLEEGKKLMAGPPIPKSRFTPLDTFGFGDDKESRAAKGKSLDRGITFRSAQTPHDDKARTSGRAYLYFWPGGRTELASIQLRIGDSQEDSEILTLLVAPLTGKVTMKVGPVELKVPIDDVTASDRQDTFF